MMVLKNRSPLLFLLSLFIFILMLSAQAQTKKSLGQLHFETSGAPSAQPHFIEALMLLHNFQYDDARISFQKAYKIDPDFAMAYWGEAMTYNHSLWNEQEYEAGRKALNKLAIDPDTRVSKAKLNKEKGLIAAINMLYSNDSNKLSRDVAYSEKMRELYVQHPKDIEIISFYALSLLGTTEGERKTGVYMKSAALLENGFKVNPKHPGILHYLIHSYDDAVHAPLGLRPARLYADAAGDAPHALHMPSHIYLALGMWEDTIASNEAAWQAGKAHALKNNTNEYDYDIHAVHALQWLMYANLQANYLDAAKQQLDTMQEIVSHNNSPMMKWYFAVMQASFLSEVTKNYPQKLFNVQMEGIEYTAASSNLYAKAILALRQKDLPTAKSIVIQLKKEISTHQKTLKDETPQGHAHTNADYFSHIQESGINIGKIYQKQLEALILWEEGNAKKSIATMQEAVELEDMLPFGYGPPAPVKPSRELLAELYLKTGKLENACKEFSLQNTRTPNRRAFNIGIDILKKQGLECNSAKFGIPIHYSNQLI